jgi:hypothetical protein
LVQAAALTSGLSGAELANVVRKCGLRVRGCLCMLLVLAH